MMIGFKKRVTTKRRNSGEFRYIPSGRCSGIRQNSVLARSGRFTVTLSPIVVSGSADSRAVARRLVKWIAHAVDDVPDRAHQQFQVLVVEDLQVIGRHREADDVLGRPA